MNWLPVDLAALFLRTVQLAPAEAAPAASEPEASIPAESIPVGGEGKIAERAVESSFGKELAVALRRLPEFGRPPHRATTIATGVAQRVQGRESRVVSPVAPPVAAPIAAPGALPVVPPVAPPVASRHTSQPIALESPTTPAGRHDLRTPRFIAPDPLVRLVAAVDDVVAAPSPRRPVIAALTPAPDRASRTGAETATEVDRAPRATPHDVPLPSLSIVGEAFPAGRVVTQPNDLPAPRRIERAPDRPAPAPALRATPPQPQTTPSTSLPSEPSLPTATRPAPPSSVPPPSTPSRSESPVQPPREQQPERADLVRAAVVRLDERETGHQAQGRALEPQRVELPSPSPARMVAAPPNANDRHQDPHPHHDPQQQLGRRSSPYDPSAEPMPATAVESSERARVPASSAEPASTATTASAPQAVPAPQTPLPQVAAPDAAGRSLPAPRSDLVQQVVDRLLDAPHGAGQTTIALDPPDLGKLTVRFQRRGRELTITIRTEAVEALQLLRRELPSLEQGLARLGEPVRVQLESAPFEHAGHAGGGPITDGGRGLSNDGGRGAHRDARDPSSASNPDGNPHGSPRRGRRTPQRSGALDVWS